MARSSLPTKHRRAIAQRLRTLAGPNGKSRAAFANVAGIERRTMAAWLRKKDPATPDLPLLVQLCEELDLSPMWLLFGQGPEYRHQARDIATLENDVSTHVRRHISDGSGWLIDGAAMLRHLVEIATREQEEWQQWERDVADALAGGADDIAGALAALAPVLESLPEEVQSANPELSRCLVILASVAAALRELASHSGEVHTRFLRPVAAARIRGGGPLLTLGKAARWGARMSSQEEFDAGSRTALGSGENVRSRDVTR